MGIPILVLTDDRWSREATVIFDTDSIEEILPKDWIYQRLDNEHDLGNLDSTYSDIETLLIDEMFEENSEVEKIWEDIKILRTEEGHYFRYGSGGWCEYISEEEALELIEGS